MEISSSVCCVLFFSSEEEMELGKRILASDLAIMGHPIADAAITQTGHKDDAFVLAYEAKTELVKPKIGPIWAKEIMVVEMGLPDVWDILDRFGRECLRGCNTLASRYISGYILPPQTKELAS